MEKEKNYCLMNIQSNYYVYDLINCVFYQCDKLTYQILNLNFPDDLITIDHLLNKVTWLSDFSENEIISSINRANNILQNIKNRKKEISYYYYQEFSRNDILQSLAHTRHIILEMTEECNLSCTYCCYGSLYKTTSFRKRKQKIPESFFLSYIRTLIHLRRNFLKDTAYENLAITFYGGEALLKMETIKKIVNEVSDIMPKGSKIRYGITTNAVLLDKYIDFFVDNDFHINISLDGNKEHNSYRKFPNGESSFGIIERNVQYVQRKYPSFFETNISFLTVMHNKNRCFDVCEYFQLFDKIPTFSPLSTENVKDKKKFAEISNISAYSNEEVSIIKNKYPFVHKKYFQDESLMNHYLKVDSLSCIMNLFEKKKFIYPGNSCSLFQNRVFVTCKGLLLPCEKVSGIFSFARIKNGRIIVHVDKVNQTYSRINEVYQSKCKKCTNRLNCNTCFLQNAEKVCNGYCRKSLDSLESELIDFIEKKEVIL